MLDVHEVLSGAYRLEVSSPGIDRPLVRVSDFERALGHEARIEMARAVEGRKRYRGGIETVEAGMAQIKWVPDDGAAPKTVALPIAEMADARLVLTEDLVRSTLRKEKAAKKAAKEAAKAEKKPGKAKAPSAKTPSAAGAKGE